MKAGLGLFAIVFLCWTAPASAHRLDEYLQATTIAVERGRLVLQVRLTPGVAVAANVLGSIGADRNGAISDAKQRAYAEQVRRDLSLALDGSPLPLRLVSSYFPGAGEITQGLGDILLTFAADLPADSAGTRRLTFENHHQSSIAVYLVNCLLPDDPVIHVIAQDRSHDQSRYQLDFSVQEPSAPMPSAPYAEASPTAPPPRPIK